MVRQKGGSTNNKYFLMIGLVGLALILVGLRWYAMSLPPREADPDEEVIVQPSVDLETNADSEPATRSATPSASEEDVMETPVEELSAEQDASLEESFDSTSSGGE